MTDKTMLLAGKHVIVIGGASGIGFAVAELSRNLGAEVTIASSSRANVDAAVARLEGSKGSVVNLRDEAGVAGFFETQEGSTILRSRPVTGMQGSSRPRRISISPPRATASRSGSGVRSQRPSMAAARSLRAARSR